MPTVLLMSPLINRASQDRGAPLLSAIDLYENASASGPEPKESKPSSQGEKQDALYAKEEPRFLEHEGNLISMSRQIAQELRSQNLIPDLILASSSADAKETAEMIQAGLSRQEGRRIPLKIDLSILKEKIVESGYGSVESLLGAIASLEGDAPDMNETQRALSFSKISGMSKDGKEIVNIFDFAKNESYVQPTPPPKAAKPNIVLIVVGKHLARKSLLALAKPEATNALVKTNHPLQIVVIKNNKGWRKLATSRANNLRLIDFDDLRSMKGIKHMKNLIIMRHGEPDNAFNISPSATPNLTAVGIAQARSVARQIIEAGVFPEVIISSDRPRAIETGFYLSRELSRSGFNPVVLKNSQLTKFKNDPNRRLKIDQLRDYVASIDNKYKSAAIIGHDFELNWMFCLLTGNKHTFDYGHAAHIVCKGDTWEQVSKGHTHELKKIYVPSLSR